MKSSLMHTYIKRRLNKLQINRELHFKVCSVYLERSKTMMRWFSLYKNWRRYLIEENTLIIRQSFSFMLLHSTGLYPIFISYFREYRQQVCILFLYPILRGYWQQVCILVLNPILRGYRQKMDFRDDFTEFFLSVFLFSFLNSASRIFIVCSSVFFKVKVNWKGIKAKA